MATSTVMSNYNKVRNQVFDKARLNRALGVTQKASTPHVLKSYETSEDGCGCPDYIYRQKHIAGGKCKHQLALELMS